MKTLTALSIIVFSTCLTSCETQTTNTSVSTSAPVKNQRTALVDTVQNRQEPENTAIAFFTWYRDNRQKLSSFHLVDNENGESFDSTKYYTVNFKQTEKYLNVIKANGFVSVAYIDNWKKYFANANRLFKANPQNDGPPENFDYDFIMQSQDIDEDLANIAKTKVSSKSIQGDTALLTLNFPSGQKLKITLSGQNQNWLIDKVQNATGR